MISYSHLFFYACTGFLQELWEGLAAHVRHSSVSTAALLRLMSFAMSFQTSYINYHSHLLSATQVLSTDIFIYIYPQEIFVVNYLDSKLLKLFLTFSPPPPPTTTCPRAPTHIYTYKKIDLTWFFIVTVQFICSINHCGNGSHS